MHNLKLEEKAFDANKIIIGKHNKWIYELDKKEL